LTSEIKGLAERQMALQSSSVSSLIPCPKCKTLFQNIEDVIAHNDLEHPKIIEKTIEKPIEKIVEKPGPLKPEHLPAVFDHVLKCDEKGCEWVPQFKTEAAKKGLEKMGYVEREEAKRGEAESKYESLI